jgi:L-fuconolactonase
MFDDLISTHLHSHKNRETPVDILDAQIHIARGEIDSTLRAMDALGIRSLIFDELWAMRPSGHPTHLQPGYSLPNGAWRTASPVAQEASLAHPDRFSYLVRIDPLDPELESVMRVTASTPGARAFRLQPVWTPEDAAAFAKGSYEPLFAIAQTLGLPVCVFIPGYVELLAPYAKKYPGVNIIIDHCGLGFSFLPPVRPEHDFCATPAYFQKVLALAEHPNVALKWSHAQDRFGVQTYPYEGLRPYLRQAIEAFGAHRLIWASDKTVIPAHSWSNLLNYLRDDPELSRDEKEWILARTARRVFNWPAA